MVIQPLNPDMVPIPGEPKLPTTLPFRGTVEFREFLKARTRAAVASKPASHTVQKGESLWRICEDALQASGVKPTKNAINQAVQQVASANNLRNANRLSVGQSLDLGVLRHASAAPRPLEPRIAKVAPTLGPPMPAAAPATAPVAEAVQSAALLKPAEGARGGAISPARPLFTRLSNARPMVHVHPHTKPRHTEAEEVAPTKAVDLTALMQSILEPGSVRLEDEVAASSPWSTLLAGAGRFTSGFGVRNDPFSGKPQFHQGIDIAAAAGTEIYPFMAGTVKSAGYDGGHGNVVVVEHPNGLETLYAHASETLVKAGDVVTKDTPIAKVGSTGRSTGPHLHFEVRQNDKAIDPMPFVKDPSFNIAKAL